MKGALVAIAGFYDLAIAVFHIGFWRLFRWPESLRASGRLNAAVTPTLNIMLTYFFVVYGVSLLWQGSDIATPVLLAGGGFWLVRLVLQPVQFGLADRRSRQIAGVFAFGALVHLIPLAIAG